MQNLGIDEFLKKPHDPADQVASVSLGRIGLSCSHKFQIA